MDPLFSKLMVRDIPDVPPDIVDAFESGEVTEVPFEERMCLLTDPSIRGENGIVESLDGSVQAAVSCFMPGVTLDMISWWAWWFPRDSDRFRIWLPDSNVRLTYDEKDADYFEAPEQPELRPFTLFPVQVIGGLPMPFRIDLYPQEEFFPEQAVKDAGGPLVQAGDKEGEVPVQQIRLHVLRGGGRRKVLRQVLDWNGERQQVPEHTPNQPQEDGGARDKLLQGVRLAARDTAGTLCGIRAGQGT